jgi:hypothetical protein
MKDLLEHHMNTYTLPFHSSMRSIELVVSTACNYETNNLNHEDCKEKTQN